jgi:hypothetical protein
MGLTLLVASFDYIERQPVAQLVKRADLEQILGDSVADLVIIFCMGSQNV